MKTVLSLKGRWSLFLPIVIAVSLAAWQTQFQHGWLEMALGGSAWLFWLAAATWLVSTLVAIRKHRAWWLLITAPILLYPVGVALLLLVACAGGDCL